MPHDLGTYFTVKHLPEDVPITVDGVVQTSAEISGGTFHTFVNYLARLRQWRVGGAAAPVACGGPCPCRRRRAAGAARLAEPERVADEALRILAGAFSRRRWSK